MMIKNSLLILSILVFGAHAYANVSTNYSDAELAALIERRDALKREVATCEADTKKFKVAGITTLGATGVGAFTNLYLASEIRDAKNKASSSGRGYGGGGNIGKGACPKGDSEEALLCGACQDCYDVMDGSCCQFPDKKDDDTTIFGTASNGKTYTWKGCWDEWYSCDLLLAECIRIREEKGFVCSSD